ncbi:Serine/threonine-protein kinase SRPK [Paramyrothecium foliicola]|nr:Serine/threonine-protein kinase SRPK [Paramyrothecium foliicola]
MSGLKPFGTRAAVASPFLVLVYLCFRIIDVEKLAAQQEPFVRSGRIEWDGGSLQIRRHFHPAPLAFLDDVWRGATATFSPSTLAYDEVAWWQMFTQLHDIGPLVAIWVIESCRVGNAWTPVYFPFVFIMASQALGAGPIAPLYYFVNLVFGAPVEDLVKSSSARAIRLRYLAPFLPLFFVFWSAVIFGMYVSRDFEDRHYWTWAWQMTPLWLSLANLVTANLLPRSLTSNVLASPTVILAGASMVSAVGWVYMLLFSPFTLAKIFLPDAVVEPDFIGHTRLVLQTDEMFTFGSSWLWIFYSLVSFHRLKLATSADWLFVSVLLPLLTLCNGPGLAFAAACNGHRQANELVTDGLQWRLEKILDYEPGGHHPVHLNDMLNERYRVIYKLGSGSFANVWLCRDLYYSTPRYVAMNIIMAESSTAECPETRVSSLVELGCDPKIVKAQLSLPLGQFEINGLNDTHFVFVYLVLGPRTSRVLQVINLDNPGPSLRKLCREATQALASLYAQGICHGAWLDTFRTQDVRPAKILTQIHGLDGLAGDVLSGILGTPRNTKVTTASGESHELDTAPEYLVYPVNWDEVVVIGPELKYKIGSAYLTDFGESFLTSEPPVELGIPLAYSAPEKNLEQKASKYCDLWALGCTLYEIRTGRQLFEKFDDGENEHLYKVAAILGRYPEPWWSETWEMRQHYFEDVSDAAGRAVGVHQGFYKNNTRVKQTQPDDGNCRAIFEQAEPRSLKEAISIGLVYENSRGPGGLHRSISSDEAEVFADLLSKTLRYDPEESLSASNVLEHKWFMFGF